MTKLLGKVTNRYIPKAKLLHISDTHLGYEHRSRTNSGRYYLSQNSTNPEEEFRKAVKLAIEEDVDAIIHTGDIFDHNTDDMDMEQFLELCERIKAAKIPFYVILGNHDTDVETLQDLKAANEEGLITICSKSEHTHPEGLFSIYGIHRADVGIDGKQSAETMGWDETDQSFEPSSCEGPTILCLHERVSPPYMPVDDPDIYLEFLMSSVDIEFDLILVGHEHSPPWVGEIRDIPIHYASPPGRISKHLKKNDPFVNIVRFYSGGRVDIDQVAI